MIFIFNKWEQKQRKTRRRLDWFCCLYNSKKKMITLNTMRGLCIWEWATQSKEMICGECLRWSCCTSRATDSLVCNNKHIPFYNNTKQRCERYWGALGSWIAPIYCGTRWSSHERGVTNRSDKWWTATVHPHNGVIACWSWQFRFVNSFNSTSDGVVFDMAKSCCAALWPAGSWDLLRWFVWRSQALRQTSIQIA